MCTNIIADIIKVLLFFEVLDMYEEVSNKCWCLILIQSKLDKFLRCPFLIYSGYLVDVYKFISKQIKTNP